MLTNETREEIERRALEIAAIFDEKDGKRIAEIVPDTSGSWHMGRTQPGKEYKVADQLAERGFGAFVPRFDPGSMLPMHIRHGRKTTTEHVDVSRRMIFPGRVFIWVWDVMEHWRRLRSCPDLIAIVVDGADRPVLVPDQQINRIQSLQFSFVPKGKKRRKRYGSVADFVATESVRSFWVVDEAERNQALDRSLGLGS